MTSTATELTAQSEFHLCLARALMVPSPAIHAAMTRHLADDLDAIAQETGYAIGNAIEGFRQAMGAYSAPDDLLRHYAALFLVPPAAVHLNTGHYLDGPAPRATIQALERYYAQHGVARAEQFHDSADHVAVQLEFLSFLLSEPRRAAHAEEFIGEFVAHWIKPLCAALDAATARRPSPYRYLAQMIDGAVRARRSDA